MRLPSRPLPAALLLGAALSLALSLPLGWPAGRAEAATTPSLFDAVQRLPRLELEVTITDTSSQQRSGGSSTADVTVKENHQRLQGAFRSTWLFAGGAVVSDDFELSTNVTDETDDRGGWRVFGSGEKEITDTTSILFTYVSVLNGQDYAFTDSVNAVDYEREITQHTRDEVGFFLWANYFGLGLFRGNGELDLTITEPSLVPVDESYSYKTNSQVIGLRRAAEDDITFHFLLGQTNGESDEGNTVKKDKDTEREARVEVGALVAEQRFFFRLEMSRRKFEFTNGTTSDTTRRRVSVSWSPTERLEVSLTRLDTSRDETFTIGATTFDNESEKTVALVGIRLR